MTIKEWLDLAKKEIDPLDAEVIAVWNFAPLGRDRSWLVAHDFEFLIPVQIEAAQKMVEQRKKGMPLAYVIHEKEFYGRPFYVDSSVLIPRPETESMVDVIKSLSLGKRPYFLEIGTGSGCIAVTLALEFPQATVLATDISEKALEAACTNDTLLEGRVTFCQSNLFRDMDREYMEEQHFDVVAANLPYVSKDWEWVDQKNLSYEPASAIYARSKNGLSMYKRFFKELDYQRANDFLWMDYLTVEADPCQHSELKQYADKAGFQYLRTEGYCLLFEDTWRYWWDWRQKKFIRKPDTIIKEESMTGVISGSAEEYERDCLRSN